MQTQAEILGRGPAIQAVRKSIQRLLDRLQDSPRPPAVLIEGETGTGKGLVARLLHERGPRAAGPFVDVNCPAIPDQLLESELFGYERGAFTDAKRSKPGLLESAHRGTIFLDEIALLPEGLQAKLLKVLDERVVRRLGATRGEPVDFWLLAATNADLVAAVRRGRFREDLYQRLAVVRLGLPPLRARGEDIVLLAEHFLARAAAEHGLPPRALSDDAREALRRNAWPGNVRELANVMERVALLAEGDRVTASALDLRQPAAEPQPGPGEAAPVGRTLEAVTRDHLRAAIAEAGGNLSRAASALGISRNTLRAQIRRLDVAVTPTRGRPRRQFPAAPAPAAALPAPEPPRLPAATPAVTVRWERRRLTLLRAALGPEGAGALDPGRALEGIVDKVQAFGGRIDELSTASVGAVFGLQSGDDPSRLAVQAALAVVKSLERLRVAADPLQVRVALHTGTMLVGHIGAEVQLERSEKAAATAVLDEVAEACAPGMVAVSPVTAAFLERRFDLRPLGGPPPVAQAVSGPERRGFETLRRQSALIGREQELGLLVSRWRAAQDGQGQLVLLVAEPGMGKSRLVWEFLGSEHARSGHVLDLHASPTGQSSAYGPLLDLLRRYFEIASEDDDRGVRAKVAAKLAVLAPEGPDPAPALLAFLGLEPGDPEWSDLTAPDRAREVRDALRRLLLAEVKARPVLLVIEDLHWLDAGSRELLEALAEGLAAIPLMLLVTSRPPIAHGWGTVGVLTQFSLAPLGRERARELLDALLGAHPSLDALRRSMLDRAGGNPFFLEESVRALVDSGAIAGAPGDYHLASSALALPLPPTVEELVAARVANLPAPLRQILEAAAVLGRETPRSVLAAVLGEPAAVVRAKLAELRRLDLAAEIGAGDDPMVRFHHPLLHEVALARVTDEARRAIHERAYTTLRARARPGLADDTEQLARHAFHGGRWDEAVELLEAAARTEALRATHAEAAAHLEMALVALGHLPETPEHVARGIDIRLTLKSNLTEIGAHARVHEHLEAAEAAAARLGDVGRLARAAAFLSDYHRLLGQRAAARRQSERALDLALAAGDARLQVVAGTYLGMVLHGEGDYPAAIACFRRNLANLTGAIARERLGTTGLPAIHSRTWLAWALCETGDFGEAERAAEEAMRIAAELPQPIHAVVASAGLGRVQLRRGHPEAALPVLAQGLELCRRHGIAFWLPGLASALGLALVRAGRREEGLVLLEESVHRGQSDRALAGQAQRETWLGEGYLLAGRLDDARAAAGRAIDMAGRYEQRGTLVWARWLRAEIARRSGNGRAAVEEHRAVAEAAAALGMRPLAALAGLGLARALASLGETAEGRRVEDQARAALAALEMAAPLD
ncbi:MAG: sigma 54-interacting transcriptional regulator [Candidatus Rokubacteria bacterium]|nr:sigma 54-interacting transcriptional regulator [Candidatus Rokubacteria bacterium]